MKVLHPPQKKNWLAVFSNENNQWNLQAKQKKTCVNSGKIVISTLVPIIFSMGLFIECLHFCAHSCVFARLDLFPKNSRNISWGAEWEEWDDGSWGEGVFFFFEKIWPPRFIGGLDSLDPRKWIGIVASGYPDSRAPDRRDPNATCSCFMLDFSICYVQLWGKFMNSFCELFIWSVKYLLSKKQLPFFGQVKS